MEAGAEVMNALAGFVGKTVKELRIGLPPLKGLGAPFSFPFSFSVP